MACRNILSDSVNRHDKLTLDDIHMCLYKKYSVYRKLPYSTSSHSFRGGGESEPTNTKHNNYHNSHHNNYSSFSNLAALSAS
jgi:hypothetical protein